MADQPLTLAVFQEFERRIFGWFTAADRRFDELDARIDARADQTAAQIDAVLHRLLSLEDEVTAIKEGLARVERATEGLGTGVAGLEITVLRLDERLSRVEKRLDDLVAAEPRYGLRAEVQDLRTRVETLQARIDGLEGRVDRGR